MDLYVLFERHHWPSLLHCLFAYCAMLLTSKQTSCWSCKRALPPQGCRNLSSLHKFPNRSSLSELHLQGNCLRIMCVLSLLFPFLGLIAFFRFAHACLCAVTITNVFGHLCEEVNDLELWGYIELLSDSFNRYVCCLTLFARGSFWYKCPCVLVWKKNRAPQRAVGAVLLVKLVGHKVW